MGEKIDNSMIMYNEMEGGYTYLGNIFWDMNYMPLLLIKLAIAVGIFTIIRFFVGSVINSTEDIKNNNAAFGISLTGVIFGVSIILAGTVYGDIKEDIVLDTVLMTILYGVVGILLMLLSRFVFDRIALPSLSIKDEIKNGNISAAVIDAANVLATAVIIGSVMMWVSHNTWDGLLCVLIGYLFSQVVLVSMTYFRTIFIKRQSNNIDNFNDLLHQDNTALAFRFAGHRIGTGFAVMAAINVIAYQHDSLGELFLSWIIASMAVLLVVECLEFIAKQIIFWGVDLHKAVIEDNNAAIGIIQGAIYVGICFLLAQLLV